MRPIAIPPPNPASTTPSTRTGLTVAAHLEEDLRRFVRTLDARPVATAIRWAGESNLAARWNHRHSTDIDLFFDAQTQADVPLDMIIQGFRELEQQGQVAKLVEIHPSRGLSCERATTSLSLFATEQVTPVSGIRPDGSEHRYWNGNQRRDSRQESPSAHD